MNAALPDATPAARATSRSARRRPQGVGATSPMPAPGSKRPSGVADGGAFPLISLSKRATTSGGRRAVDVPSGVCARTTTAVASRPPKWISAPSNNTGEDERGAALRDRLRASGLKKSIVQAQLFPTVSAPHGPMTGSNNEEAPDAEARTDVATARGLAHGPLDFSVRMQSTGLVPTRPTTSMAMRRQRQPNRVPQSAREHAEPAAGRAKEPLSARDRFYVDQRASTAPARSSSLRPRQALVTAQLDRVEAPIAEMSPKNSDSNSVVSKRLALLEKRSSFKTFTEGLARHLSHMSQGGRAVGLDRDSFLYLRRVDSNPYNLVIATHAEIDPLDYYTVSRLGITHFSNSNSEFVPLEKFELEHYQYSVIVTLPFFKKYRRWKALKTWRNAITWQKRTQAIALLEQEMLILLPSLRDPLFELRRTCLELQRVYLFSLDAPSDAVDRAASSIPTGAQPKVFTLSEFSMHFKAQKIRCERLVDHFIATTEMIGKRACEQYLYEFLRKIGFNECEARAAGVGGKRGSRVNAILKAAPSESSDSGASKEMTYTERATMRTQCKKLVKFLRVIEFLISDALLNVAILSAARLRDEMIKIMSSYTDAKDATSDSSGSARRVSEEIAMLALNRTNSPLFRVDVLLGGTAFPRLDRDKSRSPRRNDSLPRLQRRHSGFLMASATSGSSKEMVQRCQDSPSPSKRITGDTIAFAPSGESLRSQLEALLFNGLLAVTNRDRLLCNPKFRTYVQASLDDGADDDDSDDKAEGESARETMDLDIMIMEEATFVEALRGINSVISDAFDCADDNCRRLSPFLDKYQANLRFCTQIADPSDFMQLPVEDFRAYLDKYTEEISTVDALPESASCGLLLLDYTKLNAQLKPSPRRCLENLHLLLPLVLRSASDTLMADLTGKNETISTIPTSVGEFAELLAFLRKLKTEQDALNDKYAYVRNLYHLVEEYSIKLTDNDQMNAFLLSQKKSQLRTSMELFESSCDQYTSKFGIELEGRLPGLIEQLERISKALAHPNLFQLDADPQEIIPYLHRLDQQVMELQGSIEQHFHHEKTLSLPLTNAFDDMEALTLDLSLKTAIWKTRREWADDVSKWEALCFPQEVDLADLADQVQRYYHAILSWEAQLPPGMNALCASLKGKVEEYRFTLPVLADLRCDSFEERHFAELESFLGFNVRHLDGGRSSLTLGELVRMRLTPFSEQIASIATQAAQERSLKQALDKITSQWERMEFDVQQYKEMKDCFVLVSYDAICTALEESLMGMTSLLSSKFIAPIKDVATTWQRRLLVFQDTLDAWIECQRRWLHLETIFSAPDIQKQLPNEGLLFNGVHQFWKDLMRRTNDQRGCLRISGVSLIGLPSNSKFLGDNNVGKSSGGGGGGGVGQALLEALLKHNASLERIEKSLEDYLETKRGFFPRFYFISNDELLDILAHAREPHAVQRHLSKCFDALSRLEIRHDAAHGGGNAIVQTTGMSTTYDIVAMISPEGERVPFGRMLKARGNVEDWLNTLLTSMKTTLHRHFKTCLLDYQHGSREAWIFRHPAQAVTVVSYIIWTKECENCLRSNAQDPTLELTLWHQTICAQLQNLTRIVRTSLTPTQRSVVVSLVTTDVHFRDIVDKLIKCGVKDTDEFAWQQQLRYYWHPERDECYVLQANCRIAYGYEYMGVCHRLVITPLTDRCWLTITGALELHYGAAPSGPAGTGKTETSRDLAKGLGILCVVINCSDQVDYKLMGGVFNGVVQAGIWVCLDEFNRIDIEVLSVIAQFMSAIRNARLATESEVVLSGARVPLREHHIIVTMNPGYVGRTELPDNLKVSFRPVAMMIPDYALIAEIILFAEGYQLAKPLSRKITKLYKLCSEQLSQQTHYDFGMRAVRSVLLMAGSLKRATASAPSGLAQPAVDTKEENALLIRAVMMCNLPRLLGDDMNLFSAIVRDLFPEPSAKPPPGQIGDSATSSSFSLMGLSPLEDEIRRQLVHKGLQDVREWVVKTLELFVTLEIRTGVVMTGASASGKTTAMNVLGDAVTSLREHHRHADVRYQRIVSFVLNPKAVSVTELYGFFHPVTREWTDGLASSILRSCILEKNEQMLLQQQQKEALATGGAINAATMHPSFYWIKFDGPIDVLWIESMNTVLDDNKTLCLSNGERIKLLPRIQLVFEVLDTASASPATISRLGVVYFDERQLGWRPYMSSWLARLGESHGSIQLEEKLKARVAKCFELFVDPGLTFIRSTYSGGQMAPIACSDLTFVSCVCHLFESLLFQRVPTELFATAPAHDKPLERTKIATSPGVSTATASDPTLDEQRQRCVDLMFLFSFAWSFGGNLNVDSAMNAFEDFLFELIGRHDQFLSKDLLSISGKIQTPGVASPVAGNVHDYFIDFRHLSFSPWIRDSEAPAVLSDSLAESAATGILALNELFVPTPDVCKYAHLIEVLVLEGKKPIFLTGTTGSGKSALIHRILERQSTNSDPSAASGASGLPSLISRVPGVPQSSCCALMYRKVHPIHLQFSAQTSSDLVQLGVESRLVKKRKTLLGPPADDQLVVIVVDDINLPNAEKYGAQPPIELLRQYLEHGGFYDRDKFFWKDVANSVLVGAGGIPGGGRRPLCPRFIRHFAAILCLPSCRDHAMRTIFRSMIGFHIANRVRGGGSGVSISKGVKDALFQSVQATCDLFVLVAQTLLPTPQKCHYLFNLRDAVKIMQGVVIGSSSLTASAGALATASDSKLGDGIGDMLGRLWVHESVRIFRDRLTSRQDRRWLSEQIVMLGNRAFGSAWSLDLVLDDTPSLAKRKSSMGGVGAATVGATDSTSGVQTKCLLFAPTARGGYEEVSSLAEYEDRLSASMALHNEVCAQSTGKNRPTLNLVLFRDAMVHTAAIARVLMQPRGHALLLGMGGCGKRSLTRLAAFMNGYDYFEVELKQNYGLMDFREDLKAVTLRVVLGKSASLSTASSSGSPSVFLVNTSHMTSDLLLEDINILLNGGEIPKLFSAEEREKMITDVRTLLGSVPRDSAQSSSIHLPTAQSSVSSGDAREKGAATAPTGFANRRRVSTRATDGDYSRQDCEAFFRRQVRRGLHIVLCMDPSSDAFRSRVLQFPSLINCTTIDYFEDWPATALQNIADRLLTTINTQSAAAQHSSQLQIASPPDGSARLGNLSRPSLSTLFVDIHQCAAVLAPAFSVASGRPVYVTCQHYLDFLSLFQRVHREKRAEWEQKLHRLTVGVVKLDDTNALVHTLREELVGLQPVLVDKAREAEALLQQLAVDQVEASHAKERVALDESEVKKQQQEVAACQADAQKDLNQALPALNAAVAALDALDKKDITEVKGFVKPPQAVQVVMEAVCIMLGEKPDWETSKRVLSRGTFMTELKDYDKDNIPVSVLKKVHRYIDNPEFAVDEVKKVSRAAMSLCMWVHAIDTYARVVKEVAPKRQRLAELNTVLADANARLEAKQQELAAVVDRVTRLQDKCSATLAEKQRLLDEAELTKARLQRAEKLTVGLNDERVRWRSSIDVLQKQADVMVGDSVLAAACLGYLGAFDSKFRAKLLRRWLAHGAVHTQVTRSFSLLESYGSVGEVREWQLLGLPSDDFSCDSALCAMKHTQRWPLMIDPQQQASQWIHRLERSSKLETSSSGDSSLASTLERALASSRPLLVEGVTEFIDPALEPVLTLRARGVPKAAVQLVGPGTGSGDSARSVDVDMTRFRLYLTTKLAQPVLAPDVFVSVCVINFAVTRDGLEDQLLSDVVQRERAEVEERKQRLLSGISRDQRLLVELELRILDLLSGATGNLLDDVELIHALESSKATSKVVEQRLQESEVTKKEVLEARDQYRPIAATGAVLYFTITDLAVLDPMYQYSLEYFRRLFNASMVESTDSSATTDGDLSSRLDALTRQLVTVVHGNISRGLYQQHRLLFSFLTTQRLLQRSGKLQVQDIRLLDRSILRLGRDHGNGHEDSNDSLGKGSTVVDVLIALSQYSTAFQPLLDSYRHDPRAWDAWIASADPYKSRLPFEQGNSPSTKLEPFARLILVRYLREDTFPMAVSGFCDECLPLIQAKGTASNGGDNAVVMLDVLRDMNKSTPCLLLLSPGADPESIVARLATSTPVSSGESRSYHAMSLGQGQGPLAERTLRECAREGNWLLLQNVHVGKSWLSTLDAICAELRRDADVSEEVHHDFRLFLAAFPAPYFPIAILQNCVKVTTEPPRGIKANLQRSMSLLRAAETSTLPRGSTSDDANASPDGKSDAHQASNRSGDGDQSGWMDKVKRQLALGLSLFHAALQERGKFGALGWNLKHDFSDADFLCVVSLQNRILERYACCKSVRMRRRQTHARASLTMKSASNRSVLERDVDTNDNTSQAGDGDSEDEDEDNDAEDTDLEWVPWDALHYLTGQVYYGGRVTDELDRRCLMATLTRFYSRQALEPSTALETLSDLRIRRASYQRASNSSSSLWMSAAPSLDRYLSEDGRFCVPSFPSYDAMAQFVDALKESDGAQNVIGMHSNAHVLYQKEQSQQLIAMLWQVQPMQRLVADTGVHDVNDDSDHDAAEVESTTTTGALRGNINDERTERAVFEMVESIRALLASWRVDLGLGNTSASTGTQTTAGDPFGIVLQQELTQISSVIASIQSSLNELEAAVRGLAVMSRPVELVFRSLALGQLPVPWRNLESLESTGSGACTTNGAGFTSQSSGSGPTGSSNDAGLSVLEWISRLLARFQFFAKWAEAGVPPPVLPLSLFCFPEGLFTAVLQRHARTFAIPIHHLDFDFRVLDDVDAANLIETAGRTEASGDHADDSEVIVDESKAEGQDGIYISGLVLEGARWCSDRHCLCDPLPGVIQHIMPMLHVRPQFSDTLASLDNAQGGAPGIAPTPPTTARQSVMRSVGASSRSLSIVSNRATPRAPSTSIQSIGAPPYLTRLPSQRTSLRSSRFLTSQVSSSSMTSSAPPMHRYVCPVYKTSSRKGNLSTTGASTNYVLSIELPSELPPDHYVLNGVALICSRAATVESS